MNLTPAGSARSSPTNAAHEGNVAATATLPPGTHRRRRPGRSAGQPETSAGSACPRQPHRRRGASDFPVPCSHSHSALRLLSPVPCPQLPAPPFCGARCVAADSPSSVTPGTAPRQKQGTGNWGLGTRIGPGNVNREPGTGNAASDFPVPCSHSHSPLRLLSPVPSSQFPAPYSAAPGEPPPTESLKTGPTAAQVPPLGGY